MNVTLDVGQGEGSLLALAGGLSAFAGLLLRRRA